MRKTLLQCSVITILLVVFCSCERSDRRVTKAEQTVAIDTIANLETPESTIAEQKALKVKLYIENSGSMFGYVNGGTQLKNMLQNLLVDLKHKYDEDNIELYFVASKIYANPIKTDVVGFANKLDISSIQKAGTKRERATSDLNDIFRQITNEIEDNSISILLSDFIYSVNESGEGSTVNRLGEAKALTKDVFLTADKKGQKLTTNVYQFVSDFDGKYYDFNDEGKKFKGQRPYYLAVIGEQSTIKQFTNQMTNQIGLKFPNYKGYSNEYLLTAEDFKVEDYTVLSSTYNVGRIKPVRGSEVNGQVRKIEVEDSGRGDVTFQMAIAVDLSSLAVTNNYITNIENYELENDDYTLFEIGQIEDENIVFINGEKQPISKTDLNHMAFNATHAFIFQSTNPNSGNLSFRLKNNIPKWVNESSLLDDIDLTINTNKQNKTFGLEYLINGISEAYLQATKKVSYFDIDITIEKPKSSSFLGTAFGILFVLLLISLIVIMILKQKTRK
ncbi:hypothetical protein [Maribacter ulvicola]|uniref:Uncharacterized protein n=1 Tax=Maribacter ulvicola TaxID=228959 RepID=A0A1N6YJ70_9FLAO|nr:hypothetical protein [Maribacter ulvicola]SIR14580.1 hypothetical protein SAMN05421797_10712 [Maribacter ulvicola]